MDLKILQELKLVFEYRRERIVIQGYFVKGKVFFLGVEYWSLFVGKGKEQWREREFEDRIDGYQYQKYWFFKVRRKGR